MIKKDKRIKELQDDICLCKVNIDRYTEAIDEIIIYSNKALYDLLPSNDLIGSYFIYVYNKIDKKRFADNNLTKTITVPEEIRYLSKYFARYSDDVAMRNVKYRFYYKSDIPDKLYGKVFRLYKPGVKENVTELELIPTSGLRPYFILDLMKEYYMNKINILNEKIDTDYKELEEYIK